MSDKKIKGVLVRLKISEFTNSRKDPEITDEVQLRKKLGVGSGKWIKYKLPIDALDPIQKYAREIRRLHYELTLPWEDGLRLLPLKSQESYNARMEAAKAEFNKRVQTFVGQYPEWVKQARIMHGQTFNNNDYPTNIEDSFDFVLVYEPIPTSSGFVQGIAKDIVDKMKSELEARNQERVSEAVADIWNRLVEPVKKMADTLANKEQIFRDTLVENIKEICDLVPQLNLTNSDALVAAANEIKTQLSNINADTLRQDMSLRKEVAEKAATLASRFGAIGKRKFVQ